MEQIIIEDLYFLLINTGLNLNIKLIKEDLSDYDLTQMKRAGLNLTDPIEVSLETITYYSHDEFYMLRKDTSKKTIGLDPNQKVLIDIECINAATRLYSAYLNEEVEIKLNRWAFNKAIESI